MPCPGLLQTWHKYARDIQLGLWTTELAQLRVAGGRRSKTTTKQYNCPTRVDGKTTTLAMRRDHFAALWGGRAWKAHTLAKLRGKTVCLSCCQVNIDGFFEANTCIGWSHWCNSHVWSFHLGCQIFTYGSQQRSREADGHLRSAKTLDNMQVELTPQWQTG